MGKLLSEGKMRLELVCQGGGGQNGVRVRA